MSILVGGFNPSEKYESKWESSPNRGEYEKYLKPPPIFFGKPTQWIRKPGRKKNGRVSKWKSSTDGDENQKIVLKFVMDQFLKKKC